MGSTAELKEFLPTVLVRSRVIGVDGVCRADQAPARMLAGVRQDLGEQITLICSP